MFEIANKVHDESRQGEAIEPNALIDSQFKKHFYIESYGCAMNFSDSEIVASILNAEGFGATKNHEEADLIFLNTCSIRDKAEQVIRKRLTEFRIIKKQKPGLLIGVLGCMAERVKEKLLEQEKLVDLVIGPDAYRSLPSLIQEAETGQKAVNVLLSRDETYGDISPIRLNSNGVTAFVSITRGCNNMCSFCVVPFTRGRERSRDAYSIVAEAQDLFNNGYKEVTLLGQNVDSYIYSLPNPSKGGALESNNTLEDLNHETSAIPPLGDEGAITFAKLLEMVAQISPELRVRFSTSHPKDITDEVLFTMSKYENICKCIHLPVQSGNTRVLELMNRTYSREWYLSKYNRIKEIMPECSVTSDMIAGFCSETEEEHQDTLSLMEHCKFDYSYMYYYSERPGTLAERKLEDDVPELVKKRRLQEIIDVQSKLSRVNNQFDLGKTYQVLIEAESKKNTADWKGRNTHNKVLVFPKENYNYKAGDYVMVKVNKVTQGTLLGEIV